MRYKIIGDSCLDLTKEMRKDPCYSMLRGRERVCDHSFRGLKRKL